MQTSAQHHHQQEEMYSQVQQPILDEFFIDITNRVLYDTPIPFLKKYTFIDNYVEILKWQQRAAHLFQSIIKNSASSKQEIQGIISDMNLPQKISIALYKCVRSKISEIWRQIIRKQIAQGSSYVVNYDWKILNVLSCSTNTKKNKVLIRLTLIISRQQSKQSYVNLQLTSQQLSQFINVLKEIKGQFQAQSM